MTELTGAPLSRRDQVRLPLVLRLFCAHVRHQLLVKRLLNHLLRHVRHVPDQEDGLFANYKFKMTIRPKRNCGGGQEVSIVASGGCGFITSLAANLVFFHDNCYSNFRA